MMKTRVNAFCFWKMSAVTAGRLLAAICLAGLPATGRAEAVGPAERSIRASLQVLIEADWLEQDRRFAADAAFSTAHIGQVLERARTLAERLERADKPARLPRSVQERLAVLEEKCAALKADGGGAESDRRDLYLEARGLAREIAFANPVLGEVKRLLFIKRHDPGGVFHMVDQYYGVNARPGGGLFVLVGPFGPAPRLINLLERAEVEGGRLAGQKLEGGAFLSPEVSFDGGTILFAYTQAEGWQKHRGKEAYEWGPNISYHIFKVRANGTGLVQLTDGPWNDFDPASLPNGRIAFVSERRGGFLRCGRYCPTYTLFGMEADGRNIGPLSFHETHEWNPSLTHDGQIIYTRWDYVDRDTNVAHHPWVCQPDGSDPRALGGNYPEVRESRPWMIMRLRAIPGSHRFVGVAAAHHGHEFGSLVLFDPRIEDDGAMSQLTRLTPEVPFPESETPSRAIGDAMIYGTPWPLSEDDFLCVQDADARNRGIYWMDRFGNRELVYRDPEISALSPMPLQARPKPPVIPASYDRAASWAWDWTHDKSTRPTPAEANPPEALTRETEGAAKGTMLVLDVYDSNFEWPAGTRITALRIIQLLPKTTPTPNQPRIGVADQSNARAVLGTVPVEPDGSAFFEVPAGMPLYFQALDEDDMAVQSMRSVTYVHPGAQVSCRGCHEPRHRAPPLRIGPPQALLRPPSSIEPEADGSNPFSFARLVQPVLDRHCVNCHQERGALDLTGVIEGSHGWSRSYQNLGPDYGFYFDVRNGSLHDERGGSRTVAGQFGARAAPLLPFLDESHHGVYLSAEERRRLILWLDANSEFYGAYEETAAQGRGEAVRPALQ